MNATQDRPTTATDADTPSLARWRTGGILTLGVTWAGYLLLRPYGDETTLAGAEGIASDRWVFAHLLGMAGIVALAVTLAATALLRPGRASRTAAWAATLGAVLALPYYGAESFGLHAIAAEAVQRHDASLLDLFDAVRYSGPAIATFAPGLMLICAAGLIVIWQSLRAKRGVVWGLLVATMPWQFFLPPTGRMIHGVAMLVACLALVVEDRVRGTR